MLLNKIFKSKKYPKIAGIGAPSRATTLINYLGLDQSILEYIFEIKGSKKIGMYVPGTKIKIIEENIKKLIKYDYLILFSWHIKDDLIKTLKKKAIKESILSLFRSQKYYEKKNISCGRSWLCWRSNS